MRRENQKKMRRNVKKNSKKENTRRNEKKKKNVCRVCLEFVEKWILSWNRKIFMLEIKSGVIIDFMTAAPSMCQQIQNPETFAGYFGFLDDFHLTTVI